MSTVQELERAIPRLSPPESVGFRAGLEHDGGHRLELNEAANAERYPARQEIPTGHRRIRQQR